MGLFEGAEATYRSVYWDYTLYFYLNKPSPEFVSVLETVHTNLSDLYRAAGEYDAAFSECSSAASISPNSPWPLYSRGWVYVSQENYRNALETFRSGLEKCSNDSERSTLNYAIGEVHLWQQALDRALEYYTLAATQNPYNVDASNQIGVVYRRREDYQGALQQYQEMLKQFPDYQWARIGLIACLKHLDRKPDLEPSIAEARRLILSDDEYTKACLESVCGDTDKAFEWLRVALQKRQRNPAEVRTDDDLFFIRNDPRFEQLLSEYKASGDVATA